MKTQTNTDRGRIFRNPLLETFTRTSATITYTYYPVIAVLLIVLGAVYFPMAAWKAPLLFLTGLLAWSLLEYVLHRYLFHINEHIHGTDRFQFIIHGVHHEHPRDEERVFMPPLPGTLIAAALLGLHYLFMGSAAFFYMPGLITGYLLYTRIHYNVHHRPPHKRFRKLWQHHALHHYKYPDKAFGVSSPLWDMVFGTMPPDPKKAAAPHPNNHQEEYRRAS